MILALDTSGAFPVAAAVSRDGVIGYAASGSRQRAHAEELAPMIRAALLVGEATTVAVGRGPGAFTGLRVGLVSARTLGWVLDVPVVGLCSLDVVAEQSGLTEGWVVMDARRGELYLAGYRDGVRTCAAEVLPRAVAAAKVADAAVCGDTELLSESDRRVRGGTRLEAEALAVVALRAAALQPPEPPDPEYLRRPDVTMSATNQGG